MGLLKKEGKTLPSKAVAKVNLKRLSEP